MKTLESLEATLNVAGVYSDSPHVSNLVQYEHPDKPGYFILAAFGATGLRFFSGEVEVGISFADIYGLVSSKVPTLLPVLPTVTASLPSGVHPITVALSCTQAGVQIRYTTDGSTPTSASTLYAGPLNIAAAGTLKARAFKANWQPSITASFTYT